MNGKIREILDNIPIIDTHEHFSPQEDVLNEGGDLLAVLRRSYVGMFDFYPGFKQGLTRFPPPADFKGKSFESYKNFLKTFKEWEFIESITLGLENVHGFSPFISSKAEFDEANASIFQAYSHVNFRDHLLKSNNVKSIILDVPYHGCGFAPESRKSFPSGLYHRTARLNSFLFGFDPDAWTTKTCMMRLMMEELGLLDNYPENFDDFLDATAKFIEWSSSRVVAYKCASAYERIIAFGTKNETRADGEKYGIAKRIHGTSIKDVNQSDQLAYGDVVLHFILSELEARGIPVQFHTGLALMEGSDPLNLESIINDYPQITFTLLHCGFPWIDHALDLMSRYENAIAEMVWLPQLSARTTAEFFDKILDSGFQDRVIAFGGDCACVEGSLGALLVLKKALENVFEKRISKNLLDMQDVENIAMQVFHDTPATLFLNQT